MKATLKTITKGIKTIMTRTFVAIGIISTTMTVSNTVYAYVGNEGPGIQEEVIEEPVVNAVATVVEKQTNLVMAAGTVEDPIMVEPKPENVPNMVQPVGPGALEVVAANPPVEEVPPLLLNLSDEEKEILCRIVEAEVTGYGNAYGISDEEMMRAKMRVARVVINRVLDGRFPNTVEGVVYQKGQFGPIRDGRFWKVGITDLTRQAVDMALDPNIPDDIPGGMFFNGGRGLRIRGTTHILTDAVGHKFYAYR